MPRWQGAFGGGDIGVSIDPSSAVPIYQQIAAHIRRAVSAGVHRPGEPVPSLRALALELTVNPNTVQRAYEELEREGLIRARKGLGMFVTEEGAATARLKSEAAVRASFRQGIHAAQGARLSLEHIRAAFNAALEEAGEALDSEEAGRTTPEERTSS